MASLRSKVGQKSRRFNAMRVLDRMVPVEPESVTLVAKRKFGLSGNLRVVADGLAERLKRGVSLFYEGELPADTRRCLEGQGIRVFSEFNMESAYALAASNLIVVDHSIADCYVSYRKPGRKVANIWHGVPIKGIELAMPIIEASHRKLIEHNAKLYDFMVASSDVDRLALSACFGVSPQRISREGLPRYDLFRDDYRLPDDLRAMEDEIVQQKAGRRLVLYAPTFRDREPSPVVTLGDRLVELENHLTALGLVLGIRPHQYDKVASELQPAASRLVFSKDACPETNLLLKHVDILITDFSSLWVDFLWLKRPILGFAPSYEHYLTRERGFLYPFSTVFPGPFFEDVQPLMAEISAIVSADRFEVEHEFQRSLFLSEADTFITPRVVDQLCGLMATN